MKAYIPALCLLLLTSCTYSITMVHTDGTATDVVDTNQTPKTDVSPEITVPASIVP
jgi:hypothetical protein